MNRFPARRREFDPFEGMFDDIFGRPPMTANVMRTDISESETAFTLDVELPGYRKEDVNIDLEDGYLTVSAKNERSTEEKDAKGNIVRNERYFGSCSRRFYVGDAVTEEEIKAKFDNGILMITIPKKGKELPVRKSISIE